MGRLTKLVGMGRLTKLVGMDRPTIKASKPSLYPPRAICRICSIMASSSVDKIFPLPFGNRGFFLGGNNPSCCFLVKWTEEAAWRPPATKLDATRFRAATSVARDGAASVATAVDSLFIHQGRKEADE